MTALDFYVWVACTIFHPVKYCTTISMCLFQEAISGGGPSKSTKSHSRNLMVGVRLFVEQREIGREIWHPEQLRTYW